MKRYRQKNVRWGLIAGFVVTGLGGCATFAEIGDGMFKPAPAADISAPNYTAEFPDWVQPASDDMPSNDWVSLFGDTQLQSLIDEALSKNSNIGAASARYERALAQIISTRAAKSPQLDFGLNASRNQFLDSRDTIINGITVDSTSGSASLGLGFTGSWEADLWGRLSDSEKAAQLSADASAADWAGARLLIASRVAQSWFNLIEAKMLVDLSQRDVDNQERALELTQRRFDGGVGGAADVRLARSAVSNAEALRAIRQQSLGAQTRGLETLLRRYPATQLSVSTELPELPTIGGAAGPDFLITRRPDIIAAEARMQAAGLNIDAARKALLPQLRLTGGLNGSDNAAFSFLSPENIVANLAGNLIAPVYRGGALKANIAIQEATLKEQLELYTDTLLSSYLEVENALEADRFLSEREQALRDSLREARLAEERLETRYIEGLASILQLLDAQSRRISAEGQLISARRERLSNRVDLYIALGGGDIGAIDYKEAADIVPVSRPFEAVKNIVTKSSQDRP